MKNIKYFLLAFICLILITGCKSEVKTLVCSKDESSTWINMNQTMTFKFKNKKINYLELKINATAASELIKSNWSEFSKSLDSVYKKYEKLKGITASKENKDDEYTILIKANLSKTDKKSLEEIGISNISTKKDTYDRVKKEMKKNGFTCK